MEARRCRVRDRQSAKELIAEECRGKDHAMVKLHRRQSRQNGCYRSRAAVFHPLLGELGEELISSG